ncbi:helix-turn-helix transcriptional regulator [Salinarchaeum laminariae]|uniref:helix-turn-helix transcriptional regulator n=1 Tax=Salinarchaeum laminariae TaxID=869888 RepID=UPI0020C06ECE|nr:helix-turn-helix domain-containing protein [Salinarchaeum laminariae]
MGRPEWILVAVLLSFGLLGFGVAGAGALQTGSPAADGLTTGAETFATGDGGSGAPASTIATASAGASASDRFFTPQQGEFERSTVRVRVDADADARWTFRYERPIDSDDERSAFETYAERVRTEETDLYRNFQNRSSELTAAASAEIGRSMAATNVTRDAGIEQTPTQEVGYVELSFEWTNFGQLDGGTVTVGDVFEGGLYLGETQSLIVVAGDGLRFDSIDPEGSPSGDTLSESHSVTWTGEQSFADRHPRAVFQIRGSGGSDSGVSMLWLLGGGLIGLLLVSVIVVARYRGIPSTTSSEGGAAAAAASVSTTDAQDGAETDTTETEPVPPQEPLSDDRRVLQLLEDGGGRMKQTAIVEETEWSKSKVSMLLSEMEADGEIRKIQIGRENIIALEGHEPEAATSPFDDTE